VRKSLSRKRSKRTQDDIIKMKLRGIAFEGLNWLGKDK
jgi:hypothetical protein